MLDERGVALGSNSDELLKALRGEKLKGAVRLEDGIMFIFESGFGFAIKATIVHANLAHSEEARLSFHKVNRDDVKLTVDRLRKEADVAAKNAQFALSLAGLTE